MNKISAVDLSKYILAKLGSMNHLKLQKLIYYVEAYHLAHFDGESLIKEDFEAWVHGPAVKKVWAYYKGDSILYGDISIGHKEAKEIVKKVTDLLSQEQIDLIDDVLAEYGDKSSYHLESLTHEELPWTEARQGIPIDQNSQAVISKNTMKKYYFEKMYA